MTSTIGFLSSPGAGFDEPFEMLLACHQRVERMLRLLQRLGEHLGAKGCDEDAGLAARDVMRYFDLAGPAHHEDEERHLFVLLDPPEDAATAALLLRLRDDHAAMARQWAALRRDLQSIADGSWSGPLAGAAARRWTGFAALYRSHILVEETQLYPVIRARLDAPALAAMGDEMARRRGLRGP